MAHSNLFEHIKLRKLVRRLGMPRPHVVGHLECLTHYVSHHHPTGDITGLADDDIELAAEWEGEPGAFVAAAIAERFIDRDESGTRIHDWLDWAPDWVKKRVRRATAKGGDHPPAADDGSHCPPVAAAGGQRQPAADNGSIEKRRVEKRRVEESGSREDKSRTDPATPTSAAQIPVHTGTGTGTGAVASRSREQMDRIGPEPGERRRPGAENRSQLVSLLHRCSGPLWRGRATMLLLHECGLNAAAAKQQTAAIEAIMERIRDYEHREELAATLIEGARSRLRAKTLKNPWAAWQKFADGELAGRGIGQRGVA